MSTRRVTAEAESLVCSVASTRWPVSEACTAICAVSQVADFANHHHVRVLPQDRAQGLARRSCRCGGFTWVWPMPSRSYSIGSSTVMMLVVRASSRASAAYSVVVLPGAGRPGHQHDAVRLAHSVVEAVQRVAHHAEHWRGPAGRLPCRADAARARSPWAVGSVETRTSTGAAATRSVMRPSWGSAFLGDVQVAP